MKKNLLQAVLLVSSFIIVALAQPDWSQTACVLSSCLGYALFWHGLLLFKSKKSRFCIATAWFALVMGIHLNWFLSDRYVGSFIYLFLTLLLLGLGFQFAVLCLLIRTPKEINIVEILGISGGWILFEWTRLYALSGFSWDPIGLELTATVFGTQMASAFGIYGLSFWIILTNLFALRLLSTRSFGNAVIFGTVACIPYLFGVIQITHHTHLMEQDQSQPLKALLIQTALMPEEKLSINGSTPLTPDAQWQRILGLLSPYLHSSISYDLILLPEGAVPYGTDMPIYSSHMMAQVFSHFFENAKFLPKPKQEKIGNRFWVQALANISNSHVVVGLEDFDINPHGHLMSYNAAFIFHPFSQRADRYEKRILVPMGEYIPFAWCKKILSKYGIADSFTPGNRAKVFRVRGVPLGISICYEETYGDLMRANHKEGAQILVNLSNDVWYPRSRLPIVHYLHGRLRAVEGGMPLLRCCNTGVTCGVDALGRVIGQLPEESAKKNSEAGVLFIELPMYHYTTFYTLFGDRLLIVSAAFLFSIFCMFLFFKRKTFT